MSSIFGNLKKYGGSWKIDSVFKFDDEDLSLIEKGIVVKSTYGTSLRLYLRAGGSYFIAIDERDTTYKIDDVVDLTRIRCKYLVKEGETPILRVVFSDVKGYAAVTNL